jgi:hypothetical protein
MVALLRPIGRVTSKPEIDIRRLPWALSFWIADDPLGAVAKRCAVSEDLPTDCLWEGLFSPAISQSATSSGLEDFSSSLTRGYALNLLLSEQRLSPLAPGSPLCC